MNSVEQLVTKCKEEASKVLRVLIRIQQSHPHLSLKQLLSGSVPHGCMVSGTKRGKSKLVKQIERDLFTGNVSGFL